MRSVPRKYKLIALVLVVCGVVFGPYIVSRVLSPSRAVMVFDEAPSHPKKVSITSESVRVIAYNMAHGRGLAESNWGGGNKEERQQRLDDIAAMLQAHDPDILILNEVDFAASWSFGLNQAAYLADKLQMPYRVEQRNLDVRFIFSTWKFGNAILSKYPLGDAALIDLPGYAGWETVLAGHKKAVHARIAVDSEIYSIIAVHLSHRSEALRVASAKFLTSYSKNLSDHVVIGGDFNSTPSGFDGHVTDSAGENAMDVFAESLPFKRVIDDHPTFPSSEPKRTIDWFLVSSSLQIEQASVIQSQLSDHLPIYLQIAPRR